MTGFGLGALLIVIILGIILMSVSEKVTPGGVFGYLGVTLGVLLMFDVIFGGPDSAVRLGWVEPFTGETAYCLVAKSMYAKPPTLCLPVNEKKKSMGQISSKRNRENPNGPEA